MPVVTALAAACAPAAATAQASDHTAPSAQTLAPAPVAGVVVLHGTVDAGHQKTTYWFEVGPTTAYGSTTQPGTLDKKDPVAVMSVVSGLLKGGTYHARLVARNDDGLSLGADVAFTGAGLIPAVNVPALLPGSTPAGGPSGQDSDPGTDPDAGSAPVLAPSAPPELGQTLGVAAQAGTVLVRLPGSTRAVALTDAASIPVGTTLDARKGTVTLSCGAARRADPDRHLPRRSLRGPPARWRPRHDRARAARPAADLREPAAPARAPRPPRPSTRPAGCGAATTMGASARAAATASPPSAVPRGTSRTAATAR